MGKLINYFLNHYPRTDFHELNQDWMISMLFDMINQVENFVEMNSVKYADPIQWDITRQYEKNTIVVDAITGTAYISSKPVPMGVALSRTEYWSVIFDLGRFITLAAQNFANSYEAVLTTTATMPTDKDGWIVWNSLLYRAKNDIHTGDMYVVDGNIERYTVEMFFDELAHLIAEETQARIEADTSLHGEIVDESVARENADNTLQDNIDTEATARENADSTLQQNINNEATTRANQDWTLNERIDEEAQRRYDADQSIFEMLGQVDSKIGQLSDLETSNKSNVVSSINEVLNKASKRRLQGKKIWIFGDSISDQDWEGSGVSGAGKLPCWVDYFEQNLNGVATVYNDSEVGRKLIELPTILDNNYPTIDADIVIIELGTNDFGGHVFLGNYYDENLVCFARGVVASFVKIAQKTNFKAEIWFITPFTRTFDFGINAQYEILECYRQCIIGFMKHYGGCWINGDAVPRMNNFFGAYFDNIHPRTEFAPSLASYIETCIETYKCDVEFTNNAYLGDLSPLIDHTKFDNRSSLQYYMNGQSLILEGMLYPINTALEVGGYITTQSIGDLVQLVTPNRYFTASCFSTDTSDSSIPAFVFMSDSKLCWRIDHDRVNYVQQLSFRMEFQPNWCNVFTDGMN